MSIFDKDFMNDITESLKFKNYVVDKYKVLHEIRNSDKAYHRKCLNEIVKMLGFMSAVDFWNAFKNQYVGRDFAEWWGKMIRPYDGSPIPDSTEASKDVYRAVKDIIPLEPFDLLMFTAFTNIWMIGGLCPGGRRSYEEEWTADKVCKTSTCGKLYYFFPADTPLGTPRIVEVIPSTYNIKINLYAYEVVLNKTTGGLERSWIRKMDEGFGIYLINPNDIYKNN